MIRLSVGSVVCRELASRRRWISVVVGIASARSKRPWVQCDVTRGIFHPEWRIGRATGLH